MKVRQKNTFREYLRRRTFSWPVRQAMYRHLAAQLSNERDPVSALSDYQKRLTRRNKNEPARIIGDMVRRLKNGDTLATAMSKHIPQDELMTIASGELAGSDQLAKSIEMLLLAKDRMQRVNRALKSIVRSTLINAFIIYAFLFVIGKFIVPSLATTVSADRVTGSAALLYSLGNFFTSLWSAAPPIILALLAFIIIKSLPKWTGPHRKIADNYFPFSFYRNMQGYQWLQGFASLSQSGMPETKILMRQIETATPWLKERLISIKLLMEDGSSLPYALQGRNSTGQILPTIAYGFPSLDIIDDIESIDGFTDSSARMSKLATQWAEEIELNMTSKTKTIGDTLDIFMMAIMAFLYVASQSLSDQVGNVPGIS